MRPLGLGPGVRAVTSSARAGAGRAQESVRLQEFKEAFFASQFPAGPPVGLLYPEGKQIVGGKPAMVCLLSMIWVAIQTLPAQRCFPFWVEFLAFGVKRCPLTGTFYNHALTTCCVPDPALNTFRVLSISVFTLTLRNRCNDNYHTFYNEEVSL